MSVYFLTGLRRYCFFIINKNHKLLTMKLRLQPQYVLINLIQGTKKVLNVHH